MSTRGKTIALCRSDLPQAASRVICEERVMSDTNLGNELVFEICQICHAEIHEHDRFCRHCGIDLSEQTTLFFRTKESSPRVARDTNNLSSSFATAPFAMADHRRPVSGPLIDIVTSSMTIGTLAFTNNR